MMAVVVPQPQNNYENFDKKKAKALMILICVGIIVGGALISSYDAYDDSGLGFLIAGIFGAFLYVALTIVSIYCSVLCGKEVGCCGSKSHGTGGVIHGQILQPAAPGVQYMQPQNPSPSGVQYIHPQNMQAPVGQYTSPQNMPAQPPSYSQAVHQA